MTAIAVLARSSRSRLVLSELVETNPFSGAETTDPYAAILEDVCVTAERLGGDLLINYHAEDELPDELAGDHDSEAEIRSVVADTLDGTDSARFEPQVGSTLSARAGNTVSHLLDEEEEVHSAAVVRPITPLLGHTCLDSVAMKLRSTPIVLGPSTEGRVYFSGFLNSIDLVDAYAELEVGTLARRADDAGRGLDYVPTLPVLEAGADFATVVPMLRLQVESERLVSEHATTFIFEGGFRVESIDGVLELVRD